MYHQGHYLKEPPKQREGQKPQTGTSLDKFVRALFEQNILTPDPKQKTRRPRFISERISHIRIHNQQVHITYETKTRKTEVYTLPKKKKHKKHIPNECVPLTQDNLSTLNEHFGYDIDLDAGYFRGNPPLINMKTGKAIGSCALGGSCESYLPIVCITCPSYKKRFPEK